MTISSILHAVVIAIAGVAQFTLAAETPPGSSFNFEFQGENSTSGWHKTQTVTLAPQKDYLALIGNGCDSKIYRRVRLEPGYYMLTATGKGKFLRIRIAPDACTRESYLNLNLSRDTWRTDWRLFKIEKNVNAMLLVHFGSVKRTESWIKKITITHAVPPPDEAGVPTPEELSQYKPVPEIVRGFDFSGDSEKNCQAFVDWHANVARLGIRIKPSGSKDGLAVYNPGWESQLSQTKKFLEQARKYKFKVILILSQGAFLKGGYWDNPKLPELAASVWGTVAKELLPYRDVIYGYDLMNEPLDWGQMPYPPKQWRSIAKAIIKAIRNVDKKTWIIYEPGPGGMHWGFAQLKPLPDTRVIYSPHFYSPHEFTHQGIRNIEGTDLAEAMKKLNVRYPSVVNGFLWNKESIKKQLEVVRAFQQKYHVPILVGEFSVVRWAPKPDSARYLQDLIDIFEEYHWSWVYHCFRQWPGWSLEYDETWTRGGGTEANIAQKVTDRAKVVKAGLLKNIKK